MSAAPTCSRLMTCAASATVAVSATVTSSVLITSRRVSMPAEPSLPASARVAVWDWYAPRARLYAWRRGRPDAYRTLVSELMLQQTQAARVEPLFRAFIRRFPTVASLAAASRADVLRAWAGLGYNRRAVYLHAAAQAVVRDHRGRVPTDVGALRSLAGVGPYTAAAVASIAGGEPVAAIDVNVRRIVGRAGFGEGPPSTVAVDARWVDRDDPGGWNQALMDIGREHCRAIPRCDGCPLTKACRWRRSHHAGTPVERTTRRQSRFDGSMRQVRGRVVDVLRSRRSAGRVALARETGSDLARVEVALEGLLRDGVVEGAGRSYRLPR
jgi:A/G-specific adenine glycosylase